MPLYLCMYVLYFVEMQRQMMSLLEYVIRVSHCHILIWLYTYRRTPSREQSCPIRTWHWTSTLHPHMLHAYDTPYIYTRAQLSLITTVCKVHAQTYKERALARYPWWHMVLTTTSIRSWQIIIPLSCALQESSVMEMSWLIVIYVFVYNTLHWHFWTNAKSECFVRFQICSKCCAQVEANYSTW